MYGFTAIVQLKAYYSFCEAWLVEIIVINIIDAIGT